MMDEILQEKLIKKGRQFMRYSSQDEFGDFESDQDLKKPQPPLTKAHMRPASCQIKLPMDFDQIQISQNLTELLYNRSSRRVYTEKPISLLHLSYLLWATQGIKEIRGKSYATLRTVPSGGARHGFETYLIIQNVEGLKPGKYHYLPMIHALEYLGEIPEIKDVISKSLLGQDWACKASVIFYWSLDAYRCEWRYGIYAHRTALIDAGHVSENLYLAATALDLGTCAIAAYDNPTADALFELDGDNEFIVYSQPVGTVSLKEIKKEQDFYKFVQEQGL